MKEFKEFVLIIILVFLIMSILYFGIKVFNDNYERNHPCIDSVYFCQKHFLICPKGCIIAYRDVNCNEEWDRQVLRCIKRK